MKSAKPAVTVLVLTVLLCGFLVGQGAQTARSQHPDMKNFKTYEDYEEAVMNWVVDRRIVDSGKQITVFPAHESGRFTIVFNPSVRADLFLLDTQTGRIWTRLAYSDLQGTPEVWEIQDRVDNLDELGVWLNKHQLKQTSVPK